EHLIRKAGPVRGHAVLALHRAHRYHMGIGPLVPHDPHGPDGYEDGEGLPYVAEIGLPLDLIPYNMVRLLEHAHLLPRHLSDHPDGKAGAGKRLPVDHVVGKAELLSHYPHLVLEKLP